MSRIIKAVTANGEARVYLAETKEVVDEVMKRHNMSPVAGVAMGETYYCRCNDGHYDEERAGYLNNQN